MSVQTTLFGNKNVLHVYLPLSSSPGMTISYFCHDAKRRRGGDPRLNVIMTPCLCSAVSAARRALSLLFLCHVPLSLQHVELCLFCFCAMFRCLCSMSSSVSFVSAPCSAVSAARRALSLSFLYRNRSSCSCADLRALLGLLWAPCLNKL